MHEIGSTSVAVTRPLGARAWAAANVRDAAIVVSLCALCLAHRIQTLDPVNTGGDAATKWQFVREWFFAHDFSHAEWNHHMTRFGVLVPAYLSQLVLGHGLRAYYAAPLGACLVQVAFVYACAQRLAGRLSGVIAALLLTYTSVMATAGSQLLPDLFTGAYGIVMTYLYLRYADARGAWRYAWLAGSALAAFFGYLAKETMIFFYPGMAIAIALAARNSGAGRPWRAAWKELGIFFGFLLVGLALETLAYRLFTQYHSRAAIMMQSHIGNGDEGGRADTTFWKLFDRYLHLDKGWIFGFYFFLPCFIGVLGWFRNYRVRAVLSVVSSFFFMLTFLVRGINPLLLWQRFMSRYLDPAAPFVALIIGMFIALIAERLWDEHRGEHRGGLWLGSLARWARYDAAVVAASCALLGVLGAASSHADEPSHFRQGVQLSKISNDTYRRNLPLVIRKSRSGGRVYARDLMAVYAIFVDPRLLARDGRLPSFAQAARVTGSMTYLVKDPNAYTAGKVAELLDAGCALEVREEAPFMSASTASPLPASCDALAKN